MLKNKTQIVRESIKNPESFQSPDRTPAVRDFGLRASDVRARPESFALPPNENPGSAPAKGALTCKDAR